VVAQPSFERAIKWLCYLTMHPSIKRSSFLKKVIST